MTRAGRDRILNRLMPSCSRLALALVASLCVLVGPGCDVESGPGTPADSGTPPRSDGAPLEAGSGDTGAGPACDDNGDCDDAVGCTQDLCEVGGVCRHVPLDELCGAGERCNPRGGCGSNACDGPEDCDDGQLCNGRERCVVGMCYPAEFPETCDDGIDCTLDRCDEASNRCVRDFGPGCAPDGGTPDAGAPPFDPTADYTGSFAIFPPQSAECATCRFSVGAASFSLSGGTLTVVAGPFTLSQTPAPTGADFDVSGSGPCGTARIVATFGDSVSFSGRWMGNYELGCGSPDNAVYGSRTSR